MKAVKIKEQRSNRYYLYSRRLSDLAGGVSSEYKEASIVAKDPA